MNLDTMKLNRRILDKARKENTTVIFEGIRVVGDVKGSHNLFLNGEFEGTIDLTALLLVGKTGRLKGQVKAQNVIIEGEVEGKLSANEKVEVRDGGKYVGDILAPSIMVSDHAFFQGNVTMVREGMESPVRTFSERRQHSRTEENSE
ncbi:MAG: polymer-forming cytoskeletal protein [candidate division KSB1 bacterium]|nr:polymer-forming cytoskeletal protein [candidate division KSB1 bacterium]